MAREETVAAAVFVVGIVAREELVVAVDFAVRLLAQVMPAGRDQ